MTGGRQPGFRGRAEHLRRRRKRIWFKRAFAM
jgi:hypothetical protein